MTDSPETHFNLDSIEREEKFEPFAFVAGGKRFVAKDPNDLDWHDADGLMYKSDRDVFRLVLGDEKFAEFNKIKIPAWKTSKLAEAITKHYGGGLEGPESDAS